MKISNFNKGLGLDYSNGSILRTGDPSHRLTQDIIAQILCFFNNPTSIPSYLNDVRLLPFSKNKGIDQTEFKIIRIILVRSHTAKILEKTIMTKMAALAPNILQSRIY